MFKGLQACWVYNGNKEMQGVQASLICNLNQERFRGLQASIVNVAGNIQGFQPGAVNVSKNVMGMQAAALTNVSNGRSCWSSARTVEFYTYTQWFSG